MSGMFRRDYVVGEGVLVWVQFRTISQCDKTVEPLNSMHDERGREQREPLNC
jgi:hypothetical protein